MEDLIKHPLVVLVAWALVGISSLANLKLSTDPTARPDPFTGTQGTELERRIDRLERENAKQEAQIDELMRHHNQHHRGQQ